MNDYVRVEVDNRYFVNVGESQCIQVREETFVFFEPLTDTIHFSVSYLPDIVIPPTLLRGRRLVKLSGTIGITVGHDYYRPPSLSIRVDDYLKPDLDVARLLENPQ